MKLFKSKKDVVTFILYVIFFPLGIAKLLLWAFKKTATANDIAQYNEAVESEMERMSFLLAGIPDDEAKGYLAEGVKLDFELSDESSMITIRSGQDYIGYIDPRNVKAFEKFFPTEGYVEKFEYVDNEPKVTAIFFK